MTSRAQMPLVRGRSHPENSTYLWGVKKCRTKKRVSTKQKPKDSRKDPNLLTKMRPLKRTTNRCRKPITLRVVKKCFIILCPEYVFVVSFGRGMTVYIIFSPVWMDFSQFEANPSRN